MTISDEELVSELKKYGEIINTKINDKNREIFIKKLNHHKARQKVEENPSKYAKQINLPAKIKLNKSSNLYTNNSKTQNNYNDYDDDEDYENYETINNDTTSEYVQVNDAYTSPLSKSHENGNYKNQRQSNDIYVLDDESTPTRVNIDHLNYKRMKDKIEVEKTVQKYRNEISEILDSNKIRSRVASNNTINASTFLFNDQSKLYPAASNQRQFTSTLIEPKQPPPQPRIIQTTKEDHEMKVNPRRPLNQINDNKAIVQTKNFGLKLSKWLPYIVAVIFLVVGVVYLRMKANVGTTGSKASVQEMYCDDIKECSQTKLLIRELIEYLRVKAGNAECKKSTANTKYAHYDEIVQQFKKKGLIKPAADNSDTHTLPMNSVIKAVSKHPHWGLRLFNSGYLETSDLYDVSYIASEVSIKSFTCRLFESLQTLSMNIVIILLILVIVFAIYMIAKLFYRQSQESKKQFYDLVSQVVETVEKHYELSLSNDKMKPYIAISHVYDMLIDHSQRQAQKPLWEKVKKFISDHESRIRVETQFIDGEETEVWRWVVPISLVNPAKASSSSLISTSPSASLSPKYIEPSLTNDATIKNSPINTCQPTNTASAWQGDGFGRQDQLLVSPTPCLKVRNMFDQAIVDKDPFFLAKIHNDILAKCTHVKYIVHISCDKKSKEGCVYVKCSDNDAAGQVYQELNGVWYNGKLLNVKFLRNDRYLERFPESANYNSQLKPINV